MAGHALLDAISVLRQAGVQPGMHVADFGVGRTGHLIFPAARIVGDQGRVYGVDILKDALRMLEGRRRQYLVHNLDLLQADIEEGNVPIPESSLDRIFIVHTLGIAQKHDHVAREAFRLLKPNGRVIAIDWRPTTTHPVAPHEDFRVQPETIDICFMRQGCGPCLGFLPSPWHWGRIYRKYV